MVTTLRAETAVMVLTLLWVAPAHAQVAGTVRAADGTPLPGAIVTVQASDLETTTGSDGRFDLPSATGTGIHLVAGAVGYYYAGRVLDAPNSAADLSLDPVPTGDDAAAGLPSPTSCGRCHEDQLAQWRDSAMAHAGTNTWVYDIYDGTGSDGGDGGFVYTRDSVHATDNPASECASCHEPLSWLASPGSALRPLDSGDPAVAEGVSCGACHLVRAVDETRPNYPGLHPDSVQLSRPDAPDWVVQYGVLGDADYESPLEMRASYQPQLRAAVCGTCHQDKNDPDGDGDFEEDDGVVSEPTYIEWLESPYADPASEHYATCVDCHMRPTGADAACNELPDLRRPMGDVRSHAFEGTTAEYLENAASVTVEARVEGGLLRADVVVVNDRTGHHVPTGVTIRNMLLLVEAFRVQDGATLRHVGDQVVHELGGVGDPEEGYFAGEAGKLYGKVNHAADGTGPTFFTDATGIQFDTRIPALASDATSYEFEVPGDGGDLRVRARLVYRRSWRALVDAKRWRYDGHGAPLEDIQSPHFGHLMAEMMSEVVSLPYTPRRFDGGGSADGGASPVGPGGGGCQCAVRHLDGSPPWLAIVVLGLFVLRFRRRRPGR